jgi:parallel beta-helix repeat protein
MVFGNYIGIQGNGTKALPNGTGVSVSSDHNIIGQAGDLSRNIISGNLGDGILLAGNSNSVENNYIGLGFDGLSIPGPTGGPVPNGSDGVRVSGSNNVIGSFVPSGRNVISGNGTTGVTQPGHGIGVYGGNGNVIQGNYVGTNKDGVFPAGAAHLGNVNNGVYVQNGAKNTQIGGLGINEGNVIADNGRDGIDDNAGVGGGTKDEGNNVSIDKNGKPLKNNTGGIRVNDTNALIEGNTIEYSAGPGIAVVNGTGNRITQNSIFANTALGIDLNNDGVTANHSPPSTTGPNDFENFPVITSRQFPVPIRR